MATYAKTTFARLFALCLALALLLGAAGCQQETEPAGSLGETSSTGEETSSTVEETSSTVEETSSTGEEASGAEEPAAAGLPTGEEVAALEGLYGQEMAAVLEGLSLAEAEVTENETAAGVWDMAATVPLAGQDFTQSLLFDVNAGTLYGRWYQCSPLGAQEALSVVEEVLAQANELYGQPVTYPSEDNLSAEGFAERFASAMESGEPHTWREEWKAGEQTTLTAQVAVGAADAAMVRLEYAITVTR